MSVQNRTAGGFVFLLGEQPFQFGVLLCPTVLVRVKGIRQTTPAYILRKHLLFFGSGTAVLLFQSEQRFDGFDIPGELLFGTACAEFLIRNTEISGELRSTFFIQTFFCSGHLRGRRHLIDFYRNGQLIRIFTGQPQSIRDQNRRFRFLLIQFPYYRQRCFPKNRHPQFCKCHVLQGNTVLVKINLVYPEFPAFHVDNGTDRQILLSAQIFGLMVHAIFIQAGKVDIFTALPQLLGTIHPLLPGKPGNQNSSQRRFSFQQLSTGQFTDFPDILAVELELSVLFKTYQCIRVLFFQSIIFGGTVGI